MKKDFKIQFGKSNSTNYKKAVDLAKKFSNVIFIGEKSSYNIIYADKDEIYNKFKTVEALYSIIYGWKTTEISFQGQEINPYTFFQLLNQILKCQKGYENSVEKNKYCNASNSEPGWGCKYLTDIKLHLENHGYYYSSTKYWYKFGNFESVDVWKVNKSLIKESIKKEIELKQISQCAIFSIKRVFKTIDELPDSIILNDNKNWEIEYKEDFHGTTIEKRPISIKHVTREVDPPALFGFTIGVPGLINDDSSEEDDPQSGKSIMKSRFIPNVTFEDIGGIDSIIDQIREVIELPLKRPDIYKHLGITPHKGILLYGEPGNGKTLIAKAIANEVKAHFIPISGPELVSKYHGQSEENLRNLFMEARNLQPTIIFFDEIDSVAQKRSDGENARLESKFVNQLLTLMDGMESFENVTVLASTNRVELLDDALLRPGRFDFKIEIQRPDEIGCYKILKVATRKVPIDSSFNVNTIVPSLVGCSGAEIVFIVKDAAINALKRYVSIKEFISNDEYKSYNLDLIRITKEDFVKALKNLKLNTIR